MNMEQTVSRERTPGSRALYALAWMLVVLFALIALFFAGDIMGTSADGGIAIHWFSAIGCALTLASAAAIWRLKDGLRTEYDYAIHDGCLLVTAVLNNRRRVPKLRLELDRISACGHGNASGRAAILYLNADAKLTYIRYEEKGERRAALLELSDDMISALCRGIRPGTWQN